MKKTKGALWARIHCNARSLDVQKTEPNVQHVIDEFLRVSGMKTVRWVQMPKAVLILAALLDGSRTGAIFVYERYSQQFYQIFFARAQASLGVEELVPLSQGYRLVQYAERPALLKTRVRAAERGLASESTKGEGTPQTENAA